MTIYRTRTHGTAFNAPSIRDYDTNVTLRHAVNCFAFLVPFNQEVSGKEFASMIRSYCVAPDAIFMAQLIESIS